MNAKLPPTQNKPERLVEGIGVDNIHLLRQGRRVGQAQRVRLEGLVFDVLCRTAEEDARLRSVAHHSAAAAATAAAATATAAAAAAIAAAAGAAAATAAAATATVSTAVAVVAAVAVVVAATAAVAVATAIAAVGSQQ